MTWRQRADQVATSRRMVRLFVVLGILLLILSWRLDEAVRVAYQVDWRPADFAREGVRPPENCTNCRLPGVGTVWVFALAGALGILCLLVAVRLWVWRTASASRWLWIPSALISLLAVAGGGLRYVAAHDAGAKWIGVAVVLDVLALVALTVTTAAIANSSSDPSRPALAARIRRFLQRQRINLLVVGAFAAVLTLVPQTSGQAIDSVRTWSLSLEELDPHSLARLAFGVASTVLVSLVVYESALRLAQATAYKRDDPRLPERKLIWWLASFGIFLAAAAAAAFLLSASPWGLLVFAAAALALALLECIPVVPRAPSSPEPPPPPDEHAPEYLAIVPLLAIAAITVAAAVDGSLTSGISWASVKVLVPGLVLAATAVLMTAEGKPPTLRSARWWTWGKTVRSWTWGSRVAGALALVLGIVLAILLDGIEVAAALAVASCFVALTYVGWIFSPSLLPERRSVTLAVGLAAGLAVLLAVNLNVAGAADMLGVFALANIWLALLLGVLYFVVRRSLLLRPPRPLWWFGFAQLPIVTLLVICWGVAGLVAPSSNAVRLVDRQALPQTRALEWASMPTPVEALWASMPTLGQAFGEWVAAQPELRRSAGPGDPIPLVVVAGHGGGIRAAYWTALALDCIVGASAEEMNLSTAGSETELFRRTCMQRRPIPEQLRAARRIFLTSGVSGGAVGFYAYARRLLSNGGQLGKGNWVDDRLGQDFASATLGWALFHDLPNHLVGLHSTDSTACGYEMNGQCLTEDRAAVLERSFDAAWDDDKPVGPSYLRHTWALRASKDPNVRDTARSVPLLVTNSTVTGGSTRAIISAANLAAWPRLESHIEVGVPDDGIDTRPLAGTVEVADSLCPSRDIRLSTAAVLGARFPYVAPSGHLAGDCRGGDRDTDTTAPCAEVKDPSVCDVDVVDGGYTDNSGLFTIAAMWPSLNRLVLRFNANKKHLRDIALVVVEVDNHYRPLITRPPQAGKSPGQTLVPPATAFGGRRAIEAYAHAVAYRLTRRKCTITVLPGLHPGLTAPLGWELSDGAREDLRQALVRPYRSRFGGEPQRPAEELRVLQRWLKVGGDPGLEECVPAP